MCPACDIAVDLARTQMMQPHLLRLVQDAQSAATGAPPSASTTPPDDDEGPLYVARRKIYPQRVKGTFRTVKWIVLCITLGIYYGLPFVRWDRGTNGSP